MYKKKKGLSSLSYADEKYVNEANPDNFKRNTFNYKSLIAFAACFCLIVTTALYLFIPFSTAAPDVSSYSESEYYSVIVKLNALTYKKPKYKNNFDKITSSLTLKSFDTMMPGLAGGGADAAPFFTYRKLRFL